MIETGYKMMIRLTLPPFYSSLQSDSRLIDRKKLELMCETLLALDCALSTGEDRIV